MDEEQAELVRLIYTCIGMIMEDASVIALGLGSPGTAFDPEKAEELRKSVDAVSTLVATARTLGQ